MAEVPGSVQYSSGGSSSMGMFDGIVGSVMGFLSADETNRANRQLAQYQNEQSAAEAQRNRDFQERMSNTSYQRAVNDLNAAGLNPMMAYGNMGASSPSGAVGAMAQAAPAVSPLGSALEGYNRSKDVESNVSLRKEQEATQRALTLATDAQAAKTLQDTNTSKATEISTLEDAKLKAANARLASAHEVRARAETAAIQDQRAKDSATAPLYNILEKGTQYIKDKIKDVSSANHAIRFGRRLGTPENPRSITIYGDAE